MADEKVIEKAKMYLTGYASAKREMLFDHMGSEGNWDDKTKWVPPQYYWCPSIMIGGKQHGVIGPDKMIGHNTRKAAVAQAQAFLDQCRAIVESK